MSQPTTDLLPAYEELVSVFNDLPDADSRIHFLIDLGRKLPGLKPEEKNDENFVRGCVSSLWLVCSAAPTQPATLLIRGESDAMISSGLMAILLSRFSGRTPAEILATDPNDILAPLQLESHVSPGRRNGLAAMVKRIQECAETVLKDTSQSKAPTA